MKKYLSGLAVSAALLPFSVMAAVPTEVSDALAAAKTDATTVAASVIAIVVAIAAFKYMKRAL